MNRRLYMHDASAKLLHRNPLIVQWSKPMNNNKQISPLMLDLRRKCIETIGDSSLTDPQRRWRCVIEVTLKDSRKLNHQTMAATGRFENLLSRQEEEEKGLDLMVPTPGKLRSHTLISALSNIESTKDARALPRLYSVYVRLLVAINAKMRLDCQSTQSRNRLRPYVARVKDMLLHAAA